MDYSITSARTLVFGVYLKRYTDMAKTPLDGTPGDAGLRMQMDLAVEY